MHVVKYTESERGWGGEVWFNSYETELDAKLAVTKCNKDLPESYVPEYYIIAEYIGERTVLPEGYKT